jgi:hypothetical protein
VLKYLTVDSFREYFRAVECAVWRTFGVYLYYVCCWYLLLRTKKFKVSSWFVNKPLKTHFYSFTSVESVSLCKWDSLPAPLFRLYLFLAPSLPPLSLPRSLSLSRGEPENHRRVFICSNLRNRSCLLMSLPLRMPSLLSLSLARWIGERRTRQCRIILPFSSFRFLFATVIPYSFGELSSREIWNRKMKKKASFRPWSLDAIEHLLAGLEDARRMVLWVKI